MMLVFAPGADFIVQFRLFDRSGSTGKRTAKVDGTAVHCFVGITEAAATAAHVDYDDNAVYIGGQLKSDEGTETYPLGTWQFKVIGSDITALKNAVFTSGRGWLVIEVSGSVLEALPVNVIARKRAATSTVLE